jgi:ribonuclease D
LNVIVVETPQGLIELAARIEGAGTVAVDTEFHNERSYAARLMVVQLVVGDDVVLVDPLSVADLSALTAALAGATVVGHALGSDLRIFADRFGALPASAFDTQLAAAFLGYGISISLADLVHDLVGIRLRKAHTVSDWSRRPLAPAQIEYLVDDVIHLLPMRDALAGRLRARGRDGWFEEESRALVDPQRYRNDPERLYLRIPGAQRMNRRELAILRELAVLRDELARVRDVPLKFIIPDDVMPALVHLRPKSLEDLTQLRRLDAGIRRAFGERILAAVAAGLSLDEHELPTRPSRPRGRDREAIAAALSVLVSGIADEHDLPASLIAPRAALDRIARELPATTEGIAAELDGGHWRAELVAAPIHDLLCGKTALAVHGAADGNPRIERVPTASE